MNEFRIGIVGGAGYIGSTLAKGADCIIIEIECISNEPKKRRRLIDCAAMHNIEVRAGIGTTGTKLPLFYSSHVANSERFPQKCNWVKTSSLHLK
ncbi:MAG: hypothetical protein ACFFDT_37670 [Candidatus Hodarchaeota archaeon]